MGLQVLWSFGLACLDVYALKIKKDLQNPVLISLFVVGDWVTATLSLVAACSSAGVAVLYAKDLDFCKARSDSELLRYAYTELEEYRGSIQPAKKTYEGLLKDPENTSALSHIQFIRFLRRTEGVEAARRYFLVVRNSPSCTYQVYVAYAMVAFCLDKDAKIELISRLHHCHVVPLIGSSQWES